MSIVDKIKSSVSDIRNEQSETQSFVESISGEEDKVGNWLQQIESESDSGERNKEEAREVKMMEKVDQDIERALNQIEEEESEFKQIVGEIKEIHRKNKKKLKAYNDGRISRNELVEGLNIELKCLELVAKPLRNQAKLVGEIEEEEKEAERETEEEIKIVKSEGKSNNQIGSYVNREKNQLGGEEREADKLSNDLKVQAKNIHDMAKEMSGDIKRSHTGDSDITEISREFEKIAESVEELKI